MEDRCVCCGTVIPEGYMVCPACVMEKEPQDRKTRKDRLAWLRQVLCWLKKFF